MSGEENQAGTALDRIERDIRFTEKRIADLWDLKAAAIERCRQMLAATDEDIASAKLLADTLRAGREKLQMEELARRARE